MAIIGWCSSYKTGVVWAYKHTIIKKSNIYYRSIDTIYITNEMYVNFLYVLVLIDSYYRIGLEYIMFVFSDFEFIYLYLMFIVLNKWWIKLIARLRTRFHNKRTQTQWWSVITQVLTVFKPMPIWPMQKLRKKWALWFMVPQLFWDK